MSDALDKLIEKLPAEYKDWGRQYLPVFADMTFDELESFAVLAVYNWPEAYSEIARRMSTENLLKEQRRINEQLTQLNKENAAFVEMQKSMVRDAILIGLTIAKNEL